MEATKLIYPDGDLVLVVGSEAKLKRFKVLKMALVLASPVLKAMLTGRFTEAASKEVSLPADDPDAMRLVLLTAHLQLAKLPKTLNLDRIAGVAKLCDKYDCATIIGDRVEKWMAAGSFPVKTSESAVSFMWIGWAFHNKAWFVRGLAHLLDEQPPVQIQSLPELPSDCSDFLLESAKKRYGNVLEKIYAVLQVALDGDLTCMSIGTTTRARETCNQLHLGALFSLMIRAELPMEKSLKPSATALSWSMKSFIADIPPIHEYVPRGLAGLSDYHQCMRLYRTIEETAQKVLATDQELTGNASKHFNRSM